MSEPLRHPIAPPTAVLPPPPAPVRTAERLRQLAPGLLLTIAFGTAALLIARATPTMSPLIWAMLLGAVLANVTTLPRPLQPGIAFSSKQLLRLAVGLMGVRLGVSDLVAVGAGGLALVVVGVAASLAFMVWFGRRTGLSDSLSTVLAAGTAICGASAIVAVAGVTHAKEEETAVGVGTITLYGTLAMLGYPLLGAALGLTPEAFGLWAGASLHEVAQVVAAAFTFDAGAGTDAAAELATMVKLGRVLMLAPVTIILSLMFRSRAGGAARQTPVIPWFVVLFVVMLGLRSTGVLPVPAIEGLLLLDTLLLSIAMAGLGLDLRWAKIRAAGLKPLYVGLVGTLFLGVLSLGFVMVMA